MPAFEKGQPRPPTAGRRKGTPNKSTQEVGQFCREVLKTEEFQHKWRQYFTKTPIERMEPRILTLAFHYAFGRPREQIELSGGYGDPLGPKIVFYIPEKQRTPRNES